MTPILLLSVLCCLVSWVGAFPSHRGRAKLPMPATVRRGRDIPVRTKSLPHLSSGDDFPSRTSAAAAVASAALEAYPFVKNAIANMLLRLPKATSTFPLLENYVPRPLYGKMIRKVYNSSFPFGHDSFTVVAGPKGGGKTTVVEQELNGMPGFLRLGVSEADSEKSILRKLLATGGKHVEENMDLDLDFLSPVFLDAAEKSNGRRITVVLEVERGTAAEGVLYMVKSAAKKLARFANVIVILSEANAALIFGDDDRQQFIWVDGMTNEEATAYAKKVFPEVADHDLELFFDKVGILDGSLYRPPIHANHDLCSSHMTRIQTSLSCVRQFLLPAVGHHSPKNQNFR